MSDWSYLVRVNEAAEDRVARLLWDDDMKHMDAAWREMAWNDMGGSEPSQERAEYEVLASRVTEVLRAQP